MHHFFTDAVAGKQHSSSRIIIRAISTALLLVITCKALIVSMDMPPIEAPLRMVSELVKGMGLAGENAKRASTLPGYVIEYAPLVWLYSTDQYRPSDIGAPINNTTPLLGNGSSIPNAPSPLTLNNLNALNELGDTDVYLSSSGGISVNHSWWDGVTPDSSGKTEGATSMAIVTVDKGNGTLDAFYFYFYAFNLGGKVVGIEFGDHVGDWENNMIRFQNGTPQAVWFSQHASGEAFTYDCLEKQGVRPISYSALGTHANYATAGTHDHTIPNHNLPVGFVEDHCDQGILWDPTLNAYSYSYDNSTQTFTASNSSDPVNWLYFDGQWGDNQAPDGTPGQYEFFGEYRYTAGPNGPKFKGLWRTNVCPNSDDDCEVRTALGP